MFPACFVLFCCVFLALKTVTNWQEYRYTRITVRWGQIYRGSTQNTRTSTWGILELFIPVLPHQLTNTDKYNMIMDQWTLRSRNEKVTIRAFSQQHVCAWTGSNHRRVSTEENHHLQLSSVEDNWKKKKSSKESTEVRLLLTATPLHQGSRNYMCYKLHLFWTTVKIWKRTCGTRRYKSIVA